MNEEQRVKWVFWVLENYRKIPSVDPHFLVCVLGSLTRIEAPGAWTLREISTLFACAELGGASPSEMCQLVNWAAGNDLLMSRLAELRGGGNIEELLDPSLAEAMVGHY